MLKKVKESFKFIKAYDIVSIFIFVFILPIALLFRICNIIKKKEIWLICENGETARDNGYHFFKYIKTNHPEKNCYYVIDKSKCDYDKVKVYGDIIEFKSLKHWIYYLAADLNISNHKNGNPSAALFYVIHVNFNLFNNRVFLQHGITKDDAAWLYYKNTKFRYFVCGAKKEYEFIQEKFGYPEKNVIYTGFPRFDNLHNNIVKKKQILIMPTWRNWLGRETNNLTSKINICSTSYFINWSKLLNNIRLLKYIEENDYKVVFYPHINMQKYLDYFKSESKYIEILGKDDVDIQNLLKESEVLITDYSSVYMDFAYMLKDIIYYQFDYEEYRSKQYQIGYFDYEKNGFGPVCKDEDAVVDNLISILNGKNDKKYIERMKSFFEMRDDKNSERVYEALNNRGGKQADGI